MIRVSSSAVLFVILLVIYVAGKGYNRESKDIVDRLIQGLLGCDLLIAVIVTLVAV